MFRPSLLFLALAASLFPASGQRILVYSEFQRVRPDGEVARADRVPARREILSPALPRNAYSTFRVAVEAPEAAPFTLHIAQNPENTVRATLYQEVYAKAGDEFLPDSTRPAAQPVTAALSPGQRVQTYLLDVFVPASAEPGRFRLELQLYASDRWTIYPMEMRIVAASAPSAGAAPRPSALQARADAPALDSLRAAYCAAPARPSSTTPLSAPAAFVARNAFQDILIAQSQQARTGRQAILDAILNAGAWPSLDAMCRLPAPAGAEWWLRFRAFLLQNLPVPRPAMLN